jgi:hypothetical protein
MITNKNDHGQQQQKKVSLIRNLNDLVGGVDKSTASYRLVLGQATMQRRYECIIDEVAANIAYAYVTNQKCFYTELILQ